MQSERIRGEATQICQRGSPRGRQRRSKATDARWQGRMSASGEEQIKLPPLLLLTVRFSPSCEDSCARRCGARARALRGNQIKC